MKKVIAIDLDGVTADLDKRVLELYNEDNNTNLTNEDCNSWEGNWDLFKDYYVKEGIYSELELFEGAYEVIGELMKNHHVIFVTASPSIKAVTEKMEWVEKHFGDLGITFQNVISTRNKYLIKADVLIDDSPEFLPKFTGTRILMNTAYNQHLVKFKDYEHRVYDWNTTKFTLGMLGYLEIERLLK